MHKLEQCLALFLKSFVSADSSLLLALSGGPDSMALFSLFTDTAWPLFKEIRSKLHVAHIDHGWREESSREALHLAQLCQSKSIPFHLKTLNMQKGPNLEERARQARQEYFREITLNHQLGGGVLLAHHGDDQAETVLKRCFESATLSYCKGLQKVSFQQEVRYLRPFLEVSKKELISYVEERGILYFKDRSNEDQHFLRARLRKRVLPLLTRYFGKEVAPSLIHLGRQAEELDHFLEGVIAPYLVQAHYTPIESYLECSSFEMHPFVWKHLIKSFLSKIPWAVSRYTLEEICSALQKGEERTLKFGSKLAHVKERKLSIFHSEKF